MNKELYLKRIANARRLMEKLKIDALFLGPSASLEYLTGERRRKPTFAQLLWTNGWINGAWLTLGRGPLFTAPRMVVDYELENKQGWEVRILENTGNSTEFLRRLGRELKLKGKSVAVEDRAWSSFLIDFLQAVPSVKLSVASRIMSPLRGIKGAEEIELMKKACEITDRAFMNLAKTLKIGACELDITRELDFQIRQMGSEPSMTTQVAGLGESYPRTVLDKENPLQVPIPPGTSLDFDFGALYGGYCTDVGRVVYFGEPTKEFLAAYDAAVRSEVAAIGAMKGGSIASEQLYHLAFDVVEKAGFGRHNPDRLGHGIGMDIHELPFLDKGIPDVLQNGMVFCVEPQIIKGRMVARIEDIVVVTEQGGEHLTHMPKELIVVS
jgi:Xaa-Pro aminopeptidase